MAGDGSSGQIDEALRLGVPLSEMWSALEDMGRRPGNVARRRILRDSRDEPWSKAEREGHRLLRKAGIAGWQTNFPVLGYYLDIAWPSRKVAMEIDGYEFHSSRDCFESDRMRDMILQARGWRIIHVTWSQLVNSPDKVLLHLRKILSDAESLAA